jgi:hypothetical protein
LVKATGDGSVKVRLLTLADAAKSMPRLPARLAGPRMTKSSVLIGAVVVDQLLVSLHVPPVAPVQVKVAAEADVVRLISAAAQSIWRFKCTRLCR